MTFNKIGFRLALPLMVAVAVGACTSDAEPRQGGTPSSYRVGKSTIHEFQPAGDMRCVLAERGWGRNEMVALTCVSP